MRGLSRHGSTAARRRFPLALASVGALALAATLAAVLVLPVAVASADQDANPSNPFQSFTDSTGKVLTVKGPNCTSAANGASGADVCNTSNPFLRTNFATDHGNGQSCETCHQPQLDWSTSSQFLRDRFEDTRGTADQFRVNDAAADPRVCGTPSTTSTSAQVAAAINSCVTSMSLGQKRSAYRLSQENGVARIAIKLNNALDDFTITAPTTAAFGVLPIPAGMDSQQACSIQVPPGTVGTCLPTVSVFRRPLITTNTFFDSSVLWDGRQNVCVEATPAPGLCTATTPLRKPLLEAQVSGAAQTLLTSAAPTVPQEDMAAHFMTGIFTAQVRDNRAGRLTAEGAIGGPQLLAKLAAGPVGPVLPPCTPLVEASKASSGAGNPPPHCTAAPGFHLFDAWLPDFLQAPTTTTAQILAFCASPGHHMDDEDDDAARVRIACGQEIFDNRPVNDPAVEVTNGSVLKLGRDASGIPNARCTSCHAASNVGDNPDPTFILPLGINSAPDFFVGGDTEAAGDPFCTSHPSDKFCLSVAFNLPEFKQRTSRLPLYTLFELTAPGGTLTGKSIQLTDPGQALITHKFDHAGAMKPPQLRALSARGPYFHNGAAETLDDLVDFYNQNLSIGLNAQEHRELVAFLKAL